MPPRAEPAGRVVRRLRRSVGRQVVCGGGWERGRRWERALRWVGGGRAVVVVLVMMLVIILLPPSGCMCGSGEHCNGGAGAGLLLVQAAEQQLFARLTAAECALALPYGSDAVEDVADSGGYLSTLYKEEQHDGWTQLIDSDNDNAAGAGEFEMRIVWQFPGSSKTLKARFADAVSSGENVQWLVYMSDNIWGDTPSVNMSGTWRFSSTAGITTLTFETSGSAFSASSGGCWGPPHTDGAVSDSNVAQSAYGVCSLLNDDSTYCPFLLAGGIGTAYTDMRTYMYLGRDVRVTSTPTTAPTATSQPTPGSPDPSAAPSISTQPSIGPTDSPTVMPTLSQAPTISAEPTSSPSAFCDQPTPTPTPSTVYSACRLVEQDSCKGSTREFTEVAIADGPFEDANASTLFSTMWLTDFDTDGDLDAFIGETNISYWRNDGSETTPNFTRVENETTLLPHLPPSCDLGLCSLHFHDLDGDLDTDVLIHSGHDSAYYTFLRNIGSTSANTVPAYEVATLHPLTDMDLDNGDPYPLSFSINLADFLDDDGDLDLLFVDLNELDPEGGMRAYRNAGNATHANFSMVQTEANPFHGLCSAVSTTLLCYPFFLDLDNDGDLDLLLGDEDGDLNLYTNDFSSANPTYTLALEAENPFAELTILSTGWVVYAHSDLSGDGFEDLIVGTPLARLPLRHFESLGTNVNPEFSTVDEEVNPFSTFAGNGTKYPSIALVDLDADGDVDFVHAYQQDVDGTEHSFIDRYDNNGTAHNPSFVFVSQEFNSFSVGGSLTLTITAVDIDGDEDWDFVLGSALGPLYFVENIGTPTEPVMEVHLTNTPFDGIDPGWISDPAFADMDMDGDFDLVLGHGAGALDYWENTGTAFVAAFTQRTGSDNPFDFLTPSSDPTATAYHPVLADVDNDQDPDLIIGGPVGLLNHYENIGTAYCPVFATEASDLFSAVSLVDTALPAAVDFDSDLDIDFVVGVGLDPYTVLINGECEQNTPCSASGLCATDAYYRTCSCLLGFQNAQCNACLDGFFGASCSLCPGGGTAETPTLGSVCSAQGTCDDGQSGGGTCTCNDPFTGDDCSGGECPAGYVRTLNSTTELYECHPCPVGTYKQESGNDETCTLCTTSLGETTAGEGASSCSACVAGWYYHGEKGKCVRCDDESMKCSSNLVRLDTLPLDKGKWRVAADSVAIEDCPLQGACGGGNGTADQLCATGYEGPLCAVCADGYWLDSGSNRCRSCSGTTLSPAALTFVALGALALVFLLLRVCGAAATPRGAAGESAEGEQNEKSEKAAQDQDSGSNDGGGGADNNNNNNGGDQVEAEAADEPRKAEPTPGTNTRAAPTGALSSTTHGSDSAQRAKDADRNRAIRSKLKIVLNALQVITSFPFVLGFQFPQPYTSFLASLGLVNLDFLDVLPWDCAHNLDFLDELVIVTLLPIGIALVLLLSYGIHQRLSPNVSHKATYAQEFLFLTYLVFPGVSSKICRTFSCQEFDDGSSYLRADYSVDCESDRYAFGATWAAAMVLVYPLGIPLLYGVLLWRHRREINPDLETHPEIRARAVQLALKDSTISPARALELAKIEHRSEIANLQPLEFLFDSYLSKVWWYELQECARRLLLTSLMVFFLEGTAAQISIGMMIAFASLLVLSRVEPFVDPSSNTLALLAQVDIFLILWAALLLRVDVAGDDRQSRDAFGVLLVVVTLAAPAVACALFAYEGLVTARHVKEIAAESNLVAKTRLATASLLGRPDGTGGGAKAASSVSPDTDTTSESPGRWTSQQSADRQSKRRLLRFHSGSSSPGHRHAIASVTPSTVELHKQTSGTTGANGMSDTC